MSRGHGVIERLILAAVNLRGGLESVPWIMDYGHVFGGGKRYNPSSASARQSFARAARNLQAKGLVDVYTMRHPTAACMGEPTNYRDVLCVCTPGLEITDDVTDEMVAGLMLVYQL